MIVNGVWLWIWEEAVMVYFKVVVWVMLWKTEKNHENP
jgi:hypothetical protein